MKGKKLDQSRGGQCCAADSKGGDLSLFPPVHSKASNALLVAENQGDGGIQLRTYDLFLLKQV